MTWISELVKTYDNNSDAVGIVKDPDDVSKVLLPIFHLTQVANVEVTITNDGEFSRAKRLDSKDNTRITIIPITEESAGRSGSTSAPMPLFDKLIYMAGDYDDCPILEGQNESEDPQDDPKKNKKGSKDSKECFRAYMEQLDSWTKDPDVPDQVKAIYKYLSKWTLIHDLVDHGVYTKKDGTIHIKKDDFVRIRVIYPGKTQYHPDFWNDLDFQRKYIRYYSKQLALNPKSVDYVTGNSAVLTTKLPSKIRNLGDQAKIISSNDTEGYTYLGRFLDASEANGIGFISAQKAFNALRWLIQKQGYSNESERIVCWSVNGYSVPDIFKSSLSLFDDNEEDIVDSTSEEYAKRINRALHGKYASIDTPMEKIIVMALDTATGEYKGNLAITYYNIINGSQFLRNIEEWYRTCKWYFYQNSGLIQKTPSLRMIALASCGVERKNLLEASNERLCNRIVDRLVQCIAFGRRLPYDVLKAAVNNCSNPLRYERNENSGIRKNWETTINITIALINRREYEQNKGGIIMGDERHKSDRSYLFGRLLAVGERIETYANYLKGNKRTTTNAERYWNAFTRNPARTWAVIQEKPIPYITVLKANKKDYYSQQIEEIICKLTEINGFTNTPLNEMYLPGYYTQRASYRNTKKAEEETDNEA